MVDQVTVAYDRTVVLREVTVTAQPGRMLAVTGPSGAGKTTLLWAMAGLVKPVTGTVTVGGVSLRDRDPPEARRRTVESLEWVGLSEQADQLVEELSGGQQQRTALARGLALRGSVLLADEVTSELDAQNRQRVLDLLRAEANRGAAVVFATHDPEAAAACDAEVHLLDGCAEYVR